MASVASTSSSSLGSFLNSTALTSIGSSSNTTGNSSSLAISGLASGLNWQALINQLASAERSAETPMTTQQTKLNNQNSLYTSIKTSLTTIQTDVTALQDPAFFQSALATSSDATIATATADTGATKGSFAFKITQMASAASLNGTSNISKILAPGGDPSAVTIGTAGFGTAVTAGTFTINGAQISLSTSDSLQQVFDNIASATGNAVTASYDSTADAITLSSSSEIVLGSATDTSNFLLASQLYNNNEALTGGTHSISSSTALGHVQTSATLANASVQTAIQDDGSGQGAFTVNGVTINYNATSDSIKNVLDRISSSAAGVNASYDTLNNRFVLTDKNTGDTGISIQDVAGKGNFVAASGLGAATLQHGQNLLYTINNGAQLVSQSNTISADSSGVTGLSVTPLQKGTVTINVNSDTAKISTAIQKFITDYNSVQTAISAQQIVSTSSNGKTNPGTLTGDLTASNLATSLRTTVFSSLPGLSGTIKNLAAMGIQTNGQDNTLEVSDNTALNNALANNLSDVSSFFTDDTNGFGVAVTDFLNKTIGNDGTVTNHQASLTSLSNNITTQIANMEKKITNDSAHLTTEFQAMEVAQSTINQQLSYLNSQINNKTL